MRGEHEVFRKYSTLSNGLATVRAQIFREIGGLPDRDLDSSNEDVVVARLMKLAPSAVDVRFSDRFAKKEATADTRSSHGPYVRLVYHIPASGNLDTLQYMPAGGSELSLGATYTGTREASDPTTYPTYTAGHVLYELPADMDPDQHRERAASVATELETLVQMLNAELGSFRPELEREIRDNLEQRRERQRRTTATLDNLDVPLRD